MIALDYVIFISTTTTVATTHTVLIFQISIFLLKNCYENEIIMYLPRALFCYSPWGTDLMGESLFNFILGKRFTEGHNTKRKINHWNYIKRIAKNKRVRAFGDFYPKGKYGFKNPVRKSLAFFCLFSISLYRLSSAEERKPRHVIEFNGWHTVSQKFILCDPEN